MADVGLARTLLEGKLPDSSGSPHLSDIKGLEVFRAAVGKFVMGVGTPTPSGMPGGGCLRPSSSAPW
jgi:hypothetical protein